LKRRSFFIFAALTLAALLSVLFAGCGAREGKALHDAASNEAGYAGGSRGEGSMPAYGGPGESSENRSADYDYASPQEAKPAPAPASDDASVITRASQKGDKIIYSGYAEIESLEFDTAVDHVYRLISRYEGFLESSYITGNDYKTRYTEEVGFRTAHFVIRIPAERFKELSDGLSELGNVTYSSTQAQNITSQYYDVESRLKAYRTEEERLLAILEKADKVADMISIEDRLSQVRYNIESLTTQLGDWDSRINYSTLELSVREVGEFSEEPVIKKTFWQEIVDGVEGSVKRLVRFCRNAVVFILSAIPVLIVPALIIAIVLLVIRAKRRKKVSVKPEDT